MSGQVTQVKVTLRRLVNTHSKKLQKYIHPNYLAVNYVQDKFYLHFPRVKLEAPNHNVTVTSVSFFSFMNQVEILHSTVQSMDRL